MLKTTKSILLTEQSEKSKKDVVPTITIYPAFWDKS